MRDTSSGTANTPLVNALGDRCRSPHQEVVMNNPPGGDAEDARLPEDVRHRLRDELAMLRAQRDLLRGAGAEDYRASDSGDRAEALRRADDVFRLEDRINEILRLLTARPAGRATAAQGPALAEGTTVMLRFPDGDEETFYVTSILDTTPTVAGVEPLGRDSPLAKALAGHTTGDTISWATPSGDQRADIVKIQPPTRLRR
jgi:transcription elongation GreA/GreB family factor